MGWGGLVGGLVSLSATILVVGIMEGIIGRCSIDFKGRSKLASPLSLPHGYQTITYPPCFSDTILSAGKSTF